jgi:pterin-4a-carbinolamine dehydratase
MEVDLLTNRLRNIKQTFITNHNKSLKEFLFSEYKNIFKMVNEFSNIAELLNKKINGKITF